MKYKTSKQLYVVTNDFEMLYLYYDVYYIYFRVTKLTLLC